MSNPLIRILRTTGIATGGLVTCALAFFAWQTWWPVQAASGWSYRVLYTDVKKAAALAPQPDGSLLVTQELLKAQGSILHITTDGQRKVVVGGLTKPDGMVKAQGGYAFSQEWSDKPVSLLKDGQVTPLFTGNSLQGLFNDGQYLYALEDRNGDGRLLRYSWADQQVTVLRQGLHESEALTRCDDGRMLYTEKGSGNIRLLSEDRTDPVVLSGFKNPTFLLCDPRGLWISEDATHRARLWLVKPNGERQVVLSFLKAPQAIVPLDGQRYLLAEGGRNRVLELTLTR